MAAEGPQTLEYKGGQLNVSSVLEMENFTNWKRSLDDEEDTRSSQVYMDDLEKEYQARALLANSKRFFKKGTQRFSGAKATDETECHNCEEVSSDDNEIDKVKILMDLVDDNVAVSKEGARNGIERLWLSKVEGFILPNHDTGVILPVESQYATPFFLYEKLVGVEPVSGPKTIKSILKSNSTFKAEALKGVTINEPSLAPAKAKASASKTNSTLVELALICRIPFCGYGILVRNMQSSNIIVLAPKYAPFSMSSQITL
nr:retrovirus-related Pol polyprotein from transposon TNT 1-94 [Tanacetum cinerariifolium]